MKILVLLAGLLGAPEEEPTVWVFFSQDSPGAARIFAELRGVRVRPVLLAERAFGAREPSPAFLETIRAAGEVRGVDEEGLREALRLGIRDLPAMAVTRGGRTHVASGSRLDVKEVLECLR